MVETEALETAIISPRSIIEQLLILASAVLAVLPASLCYVRRRLRRPTSLLEVINRKRTR
jgi:hypothetical protein